MFNLAPATPPGDLPVTLQTLSDLVSLLADPAAAKQRVADMQAATTALRQAIDEQKTQTAAFAVAQAEYQETLDRATAEQAERLAAAQSEFDTECARRKSELDSRADQLSQLQARAQADAEAAETMRADLEKRLAHIKAATA